MTLKPSKENISQTEKKIMDVAAELFANKGFDGTSTRDICSAANVNISSISYHFGGKQELYIRVVESITDNIIAHMKKSMGFDEIPVDFSQFSKQEKIDLLFKALNFVIDYFYSGKISDSSMMIFFREQITSGVPLNAVGYKMFKKLLASILNKDENDKEVIFRCLTIIGQIHSARVLKQFSLKLLGQESYSKEDIALFKVIVLSQTKSILEGMGVVQ